MELKDRLDVLIQAAQLTQSKGILSLDDAVVVKSAIDNISQNTNINQSVHVLIKVAQLGQSKGCFTLKDAYIIYIATEGLIECLPKEEDETSTENKNGEE